jgi:V/A-type H+-transporting ATPase subunit D
LCGIANEALILAAAEQGLGGLQVRPAPTLPGARLHIEERPYVGLIMLSASFDIGELRSTRAPVRKSPEVRACTQAFREVVESAASLAAVATNLKRLVFEYRRTERRVRALENVVLPEIRQDLATMDEHLGLNEQEEVIRVRTLRPTQA